MRYIVGYVLTIILSCQLAGQNFNTVFIEKKDVDENNVIYKPGQRFTYNFTILDGIDTLFLNMDKDKAFELVSTDGDETVAKLFMVVAKPKRKDKTNKKQTEVFYSYDNIDLLASSTGIVENETNVWLHPPRDGFFRILELFPFPYIQIGNEIGHQWTDNLLIDGKWSNELIGNWDGKLETNITYEIANAVILESAFGEVPCQQIDAVSISVLGENTLKAYFSEQYGFMRLEYVSLNGLRIIFELEAVDEGAVYTDIIDYVLGRNR